MPNNALQPWLIHNTARPLLPYYLHHFLNICQKLNNFIFSFSNFDIFLYHFLLLVLFYILVRLLHAYVILKCVAFLSLFLLFSLSQILLFFFVFFCL